MSAPRGVRRPAAHSDAFGRFAETIARFFGTARFLTIQTILVAIWIAFNIFAVKERFDPYPFILLNLMFSTQAAYAAPLILLAQNRQTERDRYQGERDREINARTVAAMDFLARESAAIRIALESKVDRDDLDKALIRIQQLLEHLPDQLPMHGDRPAAAHTDPRQPTG
ncbi:MAG TPA: DUF1003 domain-containing protein [Chloroflexota bacterium]|nr:DUF1003 domain-containing protein [Chloroflexota bacterium]